MLPWLFAWPFLNTYGGFAHSKQGYGILLVGSEGLEPLYS